MKHNNEGRIDGFALQSKHNQFIMLITMSLAVLGYISVFHSYIYMRYYSIVILLAIIASTFPHFYFIIQKNNPWTILLIYALLSSLLQNRGLSFFYLLMLVAAWGVFSVFFTWKTLICFRRIFIAAGIICSIGAYLYWIDAQALYRITDIIHLSSVAAFVREYGSWGKNLGLMGEASYTSIVIVLGVIFLCNKIKVSNHKIFLSLLAVFMYGSVVILGKRNLIVTLPAVTFLMWLVPLYYKNKSKGLLCGIVFIVLFVVSYPFLLEESITNLLARGEVGYRGINLAGRESFWKIALEMFAANPIFGMGLNSFDPQYAQYSGRALAFAGAHNCYIQFWAEMGIIGTGIYIATICTCVRRSFRLLRFAKDKDVSAFVNSSLSVMLVLIIYALTGNPFYQPQEFYLFALMVSFNNSLSQMELYNHESNSTTF